MRTTEPLHNAFLVSKAGLLSELRAADSQVDSISCTRIHDSDDVWELVKPDIDYIEIGRNDQDESISALDLFVKERATSSSAALPSALVRDLSYNNRPVTLGMIFERYWTWHNAKEETLPSGKQRTNDQLKAMYNINRTTYIADGKCVARYNKDQQKDPTICAQRYKRSDFN
jgi:hypothetical protein